MVEVSLTNKILCVGNCVLDRVYEVENLPLPGQKVLMLNRRESGGGPAATAAVAIAHLSGSAFFSGIVGEDASGAMLRRMLAEHSVDASLLASSHEMETPTPIVIVDRAGERCIIVQQRKQTSNRISFEDLSPFALVLADTRWPQGAEAALSAAGRVGALRVLDADGGDMAVLRRLVALSDHVIFSQQGLAEFAEQKDLEAQLFYAAEHGPKIVAVTVGAQGSYWLIDGSVRHVEAFPVSAEDTTGCGDVFHGAYSLAVVEGEHPIAAARFAAAAAALKAARGMGWDGMPDRSAVEGLLKSEA